MAENDANLLSTHYFDSAAEATEAVRAADLLGLGVALSNRIVPDTDSDDDSFVEEIGRASCRERVLMPV